MGSPSIQERGSGPGTSLWTPQQEGYMGGLAEEDPGCGQQEVCLGKDSRGGLGVCTAGRDPRK